MVWCRAAQVDAARGVRLCHSWRIWVWETPVFYNLLDIYPRGKHFHYYSGQQSNPPSAWETDTVSSKAVCYSDMLAKTVQDESCQVSIWKTCRNMGEWWRTLSRNGFGHSNRNVEHLQNPLAPGTVLSALHTFTHLILSGFYFCPHFTDEKKEGQRNGPTNDRSGTPKVWFLYCSVFCRDQPAT